ncbi:MAG: hypothetical protein SLAVMIC_00390 [uncultured marine phage]|uniref:Uncharacterized protein n=1 Tax=uncultured marine phage TaxID=707152 RepID=A0A8D9FRI0_9VIRU|nr:MAG: hypothetical protein SLAVMIC_00390 [uncultured marine phage]
MNDKKITYKPMNFDYASLYPSTIAIDKWMEKWAESIRLEKIKVRNERLDQILGSQSNSNGDI